jgi:proline iminopeptidase
VHPSHPVYLVQRAHEADGRAVLADEWYRLLRAAHKELIVLDTSGHRPIFEQPTEFHEVMTDVLADTGVG